MPLGEWAPPRAGGLCGRWGQRLGSEARARAWRQGSLELWPVVEDRGALHAQGVRSSVLGPKDRSTGRPRVSGREGGSSGLGPGQEEGRRDHPVGLTVASELRVQALSQCFPGGHLGGV